MPDPKPGESEDDYVDRCIPFVIEDGSASSPEQATAMCHDMYQRYQEEHKEVFKGTIFKETFNCECLDCGHQVSSTTHCVDMTCPKCGGQMRRVERPGSGR